MAAVLQVKMAAIKIRDDLSDLEGPGEAFIFHLGVCLRPRSSWEGV